MVQGPVGVNILSNVVGIGGSNVGAFGDIVTAQLTPLIQLDFIFGINTQTGTSTTANSATVDTDASRLRLQTGTNVAGAATFQSNRIARYRQGEGMEVRFTAVWVSSAANSTQVVGMGNTQVGYFFGYNGTAFGVSLRNGGVDNWTAQTAWNGDKCDGTGASGFNWNKTLGNVMMIRYPYLGYGQITYWVQNPVTGAWILCHSIQYPNSSASVQVSNASFPFWANATNSGNNTNLITYVGSVGVFITGIGAYLGAQWAIDNTKTVSTELNVFSLRNCTTYNGVTNSGIIRLRSISFAYNAGGSNVSILKLKKGVTLGGSPSYTTINGSTGDNGVTITSGNSIASYDTAGTTVTGGTYIFNLTTSTSAATSMDLTPFLIFINPAETMTFSVTQTLSNPVIVGVNWNEDV